MLVEGLAREHFDALLGAVAGGGVDTGSGRHVERLHVGNRAGVYILCNESIQRRCIVEALHLDGDAVFIRPFLQEPGFGHVLVGIPAHIDRPPEGEGRRISSRVQSARSYK